MPLTLNDKVLGCLYGGSIGDALGAPAEGKTPEQIRLHYSEIVDLVEPWDGPSPVSKGDGRYTDDTHMVQLLGRLYVEVIVRFDVFRFASGIVPLIADEQR